MPRPRSRLPAPCLDCGLPTTQGSRCKACEAAHQAARWGRRGITTPDRARRAATVAQWVVDHGQWCPGWGRPGHGVVPPNVLTADHVKPIALGGNPMGQLAVLCRECNGRKAARPIQ